MVEIAGDPWSCQPGLAGASRMAAWRGGLCLTPNFAIASSRLPRASCAGVFPHRHGDALPVTTWNHDGTQLSIEAAGKRQSLSLSKALEGVDLQPGQITAAWAACGRFLRTQPFINRLRSEADFPNRQRYARWVARMIDYARDGQVRSPRPLSRAWWCNACPRTKRKLFR